MVTGSVTAILTIIESVSYAALIFSGVLAVNISTGIGVALTAAAVAGLIMSITSSYPGTIAVPQNKIAPILALIAASVVATMPAGATDEQTLLTVIAAIVISSLVTGRPVINGLYVKRETGYTSSNFTDTYFSVRPIRMTSPFCLRTPRIPSDCKWKKAG